MKIKLTLFYSFVLSLMFVADKLALAVGKCTINGQEVPCEQLGNQMKGLLGLGIGIFIVGFAIIIWMTVFWLMMLIHAAKYDVKDKVVWILLIVFTGIIGAIIYYFMVKRDFNKQQLSQQPPQPNNPQI